MSTTLREQFNAYIESHPELFSPGAKLSELYFILWQAGREAGLAEKNKENTNG